MKKLFAILATVSLLTGCGPGFQPIHNEIPDVGIISPDGLIVKSRAVYLISTENGQTVVKRVFSYIIPTAHATNPTTIPISVVNAPNSSMTVNSATLVAPVITNDPLEFGSLTITALRDNHLKVCGNNNNQKCGTAVIRMYTTGTAGAGLYNSADGYGAPITAGRGTTRTAVGLGPSNAAIVQTYTIPSNRNVIRDSHFESPMTYNVSVDFTDAGAGTYSTTLVVEYGLAL